MSTSAVRKAVVLVSGGVDSATVLAIAKAEGFAVHALTFRYGQRHRVEVQRATEVARKIGVADHAFMDIDLRAIGGSALTSETPVPKDRSDAEIGEGIPSTYVPARNTIFLSLALARAEVLAAERIYIGVNAVDYSGYPDCRPEYIAAFQAMANLATRAGVEGREVRIVTPLISLTKGEIIRRGIALGVDYALTSSCYEPSDAAEACGRCDSCRIRLKGFAEAGIPDPIPYGPFERSVPGELHA